MPFSTFGKNKLLDALTTTVYASLHSANPGDSGTSELSGGSPSYARKSVTLGAASGGVKAASTQPVFDVPSGATVAWVGWWDALSGGNFLASYDVADEVYGAQGTYTLTAESFSIT